MLDPNVPLLIIGDLNEDLLSVNGSDLSKFMDENCMVNCIQKPTRIRSCLTKDGYKLTKTLLDVCLHSPLDNHGLAITSDVIGCPFSDHSFICISLNATCVKTNNEQIFGRNLCQDNLNRIISALKRVNFNEALKYNETYRQWGWIKNKILKCINEIAPIKRLKKKKAKNNYPWFDKELALVKRQRDFLYTVATASDEIETIVQQDSYSAPQQVVVQDPVQQVSNEWINYQEYRRKFESLKRSKMCAYFNTKSIKDFKNSKLFWKFYSSSIKTKNSDDDRDFPDYLIINDDKIDDKSEMPDAFNSFFSKITCNSKSNRTECLRFIDKTFSNLKQNNKVNTLVNA